MSEFSTAFSLDLDPTKAAHSLAGAVELAFGGPDHVGGAFLYSTAASGPEALEIGALLTDRWPEASLMGTSFEGILAQGQVFRDRPASGLLAWRQGPEEPVPFYFEAAETDLAPLVHDLEHALGGERLAPDDLLLLFPDALASTGLETRLLEFLPALGEPSVAGAAAAGVLGGAALAWVGRDAHPAATLGLVVRGAGARGGSRVECAEAGRVASPWLEISACRERWIDGLEGEPPVDWIRRQLGLEGDRAIEPYLDRLLVRLRRGGESDEADWDAEEPGDGIGYLERYVIGVDDRSGAISVPGQFRRGDRLAFALPDPDRARERLRAAVAGLVPNSLVVQFACRARDAALHGDADLESALVAHAALGREAIGTLAPFQLGPDAAGACRLLVHSTVLAALGGD